MFIQYAKPIILLCSYMHLCVNVSHMMIIMHAHNALICIIMLDTLVFRALVILSVFHSVCLLSLFLVSKYSYAAIYQLFFIPDGFCFYFLHGFSYSLFKTTRICQQVSLFDARSALGNCRRPQNHKPCNTDLKGGLVCPDIASVASRKGHTISQVLTALELPAALRQVLVQEMDDNIAKILHLIW